MNSHAPVYEARRAGHARVGDTGEDAGEDARATIWARAIPRCRPQKVSHALGYVRQVLVSCSLPRAAHRLTVDLVSDGAAIWDMEVQIEIVVPETRNLARGCTRTIILGLRPYGAYTNPLNAGQGVTWMTWVMWSDEMLTADFRDHICMCPPYVPHRNISLCIYCSQKRKLLRRIGHSLFHWQLDLFFEKTKVKLPRYLYQYLVWKNRHIIQTEGRSMNIRYRGWTPPWKQGASL